MVFAIECFRVLNHHVEPETRFDLLDDMGEFRSSDAFNRRVISGEGHEKVYNTFADASLLTFFVDVLVLGKVKQNFGVGVVLILWFCHLRF